MATKFKLNTDPEKGRCLISTNEIHSGEIIFEESPLICSQYLWNQECKYDCCQFCMAPLETAEENVSRLTKTTNINLPFIKDCCCIDKSKHVKCHQNECFERYCSEDCRQKAFDSHHKLLCPSKSSELASNLRILCDMWKSIHYPPETASIMLIAKILARIKLDPTFIQKLQQFSCNTMAINDKEQIIHKLCGDNFKQQIVSLKNQLCTIFDPNDELLKPFLTEDGLGALLALIGRNSQEIGTSSFVAWTENCQRLVGNDPEECLKINQLVDSLYEKIEEVTGISFLHSEGTGLYEMQSCINHSCEPNAEVCFPHNNFVLALKAKQPISPGEEIQICYLDECMRDRSRHSRMKYLRENYLFTCKCPKCQRQINDPDVTSDEDEIDGHVDSDLNSEPDEDMNID